MNSRILGYIAVAAVIARDAAPGILAAQSVSAQSAIRFTLAGTITSPDGSAVSDAEVTVLAGPSDSLRLRSDSLGKVRATGLAVSSVTVRVRRLGYQPKSVDVTLRESLSPILIQLEPNPA